jgi:hypothetical protein
MSGPLMPSGQPGTFSISGLCTGRPPAMSAAVDNERGQALGSGLDGGGQARGACADDDDVVHHAAPR